MTKKGQTKIQFEVVHLTGVDKFCFQCPAYNFYAEFCHEYSLDKAPLESACVRGYYLIENKIVQESGNKRGEDNGRE